MNFLRSFLEAFIIQSIEEYEKLDPRVTLDFQEKKLIYCTPNSATVWRVQTLGSKEPDTLTWILRFQEGDILCDIGANVGMYTIFAAIMRKCRVFAFEPESQNFAVLNKNIFVNQLMDRVKAYCIALSDKAFLDTLYLSQFQTGGSCHNFGEEKNFAYEKLHSVFPQGSVSFTLDELIEKGSIPCPHHIKIDVDGIEPKVVHGLKNTLKNPLLKSILVEINTNLEDHRQIILDLAQHGFTHNPEETIKSIRHEGPFKGVGNHVFRR